MGQHSSTAGTQVTWLGHVLTQLIASAVCIGVPVLVTLMAPVSTVQFEKSAGGNRATVTRYVLLLIPWKSVRVDEVTAVRAEITAERHHRTAEERRRGNTGTLLATGQIVLVNESGEVIVQAAPDIARNLSDRMNEFIAAPSAEPFQVTVYASWPLTYLVGGALTGLCLFYITCVILAILVFPLKIVRKVLTPPREPDQFN